MKIGDCFYLGYIQKTIGNKGELAFKLDVDSPSSYTSLESVGIQLQKGDNSCIPFFIVASKLLHSGVLRVQLEGVESALDAKALVGKQLYLPIEMLPALSGNKFYFHEIINFEVIDKVYGTIGSVKEVLEFSTSNLLCVHHPSGNEILIPITDTSILHLDRSKHTLEVATAEGLIDLYLEKD